MQGIDLLERRHGGVVGRLERDLRSGRVVGGGTSVGSPRPGLRGSFRQHVRRHCHIRAAPRQAAAPAQPRPGEQSFHPALRPDPDGRFRINEFFCGNDAWQQAVTRLLTNKEGIILVTGPTGSGKTTTLYTALRQLQQRGGVNIVTVEDPVEYRLGGVVQVQVNERAGLTFAAALRSILRQDPDVVLVGEMRDLETIEAALTISETGHLALATLHTNGCVQTINRIVDVFPPHQQSQVRAQLSFVLEGIVSQQLLPHASGRGRCVAVEVMVPNPAIRNLIREDKVHQIYSAMQVGQSRSFMQTMNQSLYKLYRSGDLSLEDALARSTDAEELRTMIEQGGSPTAGRTGGGDGGRGGRIRYT
mgnify:CR=1 FL=1